MSGFVAMSAMSALVAIVDFDVGDHRNSGKAPLDGREDRREVAFFAMRRKY